MPALDGIRLRCPTTGQGLRPVLPDSMEFGELQSEFGAAVPGGLDGFLVSPDRSSVYPVVRGVPQLIEGQALRCSTTARLDARRLGEVAEEAAIYDRIVETQRVDAEAGLRILCGPVLQRHLQERQALGVFPDPASVWLDAAGSADTQYCAYAYLAPLMGAVFVQLGGSGSHAIRALLAGARCVALVSPSQEEILIARDVASRLGFGDALCGIRGIGESIPIDDAWADRVYGGGCLHHTVVAKSLPEVARILAPSGKASFVDPRANCLYSMWQGLLGRRRFCGMEEGTHDQPLDVEQVAALAKAHFAQIEVYSSGGLLRYALVLCERILGITPRIETALRWLRAEHRLMSALGLARLFNNFALLLER